MLFYFSIFWLYFFFFVVKPKTFCSAMFFSDLNIDAWNVITIITSLGNRVLIGTPSEISKFGLSSQFSAQEFSADLEVHELALQRGKLGILQGVMTDVEF